MSCVPTTRCIDCRLDISSQGVSIISKRIFPVFPLFFGVCNNVFNLIKLMLLRARGIHDDLATLYGTNMSFIYPGASFRISNRRLEGREQLDFSRTSADKTFAENLTQYGDGCGCFLKSY